MGSALLRADFAFYCAQKLLRGERFCEIISLFIFICINLWRRRGVKILQICVSG